MKRKIFKNSFIIIKSIRLFRKLGYEIKITNLKKTNNSKVGKPSSTSEKHQLILKIAKKYNINTLIETGTYLGEMVYATKDYFKKIITIELSEELVINARQKFDQYPHIKVICGDSGSVFQTLLPTLNEICIFWLDGHFSGGITERGDTDAPIENELNCIIKSIQKGLKHIILIDDARLFIQNNIYTGYPTFYEIQQRILNNIPEYNLEVIKDVIVIFYSS